MTIFKILIKISRLYFIFYNIKHYKIIHLKKNSFIVLSLSISQAVKFPIFSYFFLFFEQFLFIPIFSAIFLFFLFFVALFLFFPIFSGSFSVCVQLTPLFTWQTCLKCKNMHLWFCTSPVLNPVAPVTFSY